MRSKWNPTELELFYRAFFAKALVLVNPTELELFYQDFCAKALVLVNSTSKGHTISEWFYEVLGETMTS